MEDMGFPWSNINHRHHQHQDFQESFVFGSANNIFFNPIHDYLPKSDSIICSDPIATASTQQMGPTSSSFDGDESQYWSQTLDGGKNVIPITKATTATTVTYPESLDCLLSATTINNNNNNNNLISGVSSGNSVSKEADDGIIVSSGKRQINASYYDHPPRSKRSRLDSVRPASSTINFRQASSESDETDSEAIAQMKEMIYRAAAFRPVSFADDEELREKPRRKNVRISSDPQTVAARQRRERISDRIRVLQKLVPGGNKMDTASMLDEAANYLKFLRSQVKELEQFGQKQLEYHVSSYGATTNAHSTSQIFQNHCINPNVNVTSLGVPFPMQAHFLLPHHQQLHLP